MLSSLLTLLILLCCGFAASCDLGTKNDCVDDPDCLNGLSCIEGTCFDCGADRAGCECIGDACLNGLVCDEEGRCTMCSAERACGSGLACVDRVCVPCTNQFAGCPCEAGRCGPDLRCDAANVCEALACTDATQNGDETDIDCGGSCVPCAEGLRCLAAADCESLACDQGACLAIGSCLVGTKEFPTIQAAVDDTGCTLILIDEGDFAEQVRINRSIEMVGVARVEALADGTVLRNPARAPVIEIAEGVGAVRLRHLTIRDGAAFRGAAVSSKRDLLVEDCVFIDNRASVNAVLDDEQPHPCGGAIFVEDANLTVRNSVFVGNQAEETRFVEQRIPVEASGGAICVAGAGELLVDSSDFSRNVAITTTDIPAGTMFPPPPGVISTSSGGAIYRSDEGSTVVRDSTFSNNATRSSVLARGGETRLSVSVGGAIAAPEIGDSPEATVLERTTFVDNWSHADAADVGSFGAVARGGAVALGGALIRDTTFEHNWALAKSSAVSSSRGGGADLRRGRIESTRFLRNRVDATEAMGGALRVRQQSTIVNSVLWDNLGSGSSGIRAESADALVWLVNTTLVDNAPGPQLDVVGGELFLRHSVLTGGHGACDIARIQSAGYNVFQNSDCLAPLATATDRVVAAPQIESVYNRTAGFRAIVTDDLEGVFSAPGFPLVGSPVIDGGDPNGCRGESDNIITVDNLGAPRSGTCDIGAFAFQPNQPTLSALSALILRRVTARTPEFFAPDEGLCANSVTQELVSFINESIGGDGTRSPDEDRDGLLDTPLLLILSPTTSSNIRADLSPAECVATHVACADPLAMSRFATNSLLRISGAEPCTLDEGSVMVEPGVHGCVTAGPSVLIFDIGVRFWLRDAELIGELDVLPERISNGVVRGFVTFDDASNSSIPSSIQATLGGAATMLDLLCPSDLEERDGSLGVFVELGVEFEAVTLFGVGLPPVRLAD